MAIHIPPPSKWSHKHIILVTLTGTLVVIAIAAVISISLSPAHIYFSIADAKAGMVVEDTKYYTFTLVARNSSPRMAVLYGALNVEIWYSPTAWVPAVVDRSALQDGRRQPPRNVTYTACVADYWQSEQASSSKPTPPSPSSAGSPPPATNETDWSNCTVVVTAKVWFKSGGISTRSYNVRASCSPVNFDNATAPNVSCTYG